MAATTNRGANKRKRGPTTKEEKEEKPPPVPVPVPLPHDVCVEIAKHVHEDEALAFASSCKGFRDAMKESLRGRENTVFTGKRRKVILTTRVSHYWNSETYFGKACLTPRGKSKRDEGFPVSEAWIKLAFYMN